MIHKKITYIYLSILIVSYSCGAGVGDTTKRLSEDFIYRTDGNCRYILASSIYQEGIYPNIVDYNYDNNFILVRQEPSIKYLRIFLAEKIRGRFNIMNNAEDILNHKQIDYLLLKILHITDSSFFDHYVRDISSDNTLEDIHKSEIIADSLIKKSPYYQLILSRKINYWIISHRDSNKLYGPLLNEEYLKKRKELGIPEKLKLDSE